MKKHAPIVVALVVAVAVVFAAAAFALRSAPRAPSVASAPEQRPVTAADRSGMTTSFSVVDTQAKEIEPTITEPKRVFDSPQRTAGTARRLQAHNADFYVPPPEYLLSQGIVRVRDAGKRVAFTFDDGPSDNTAEILRILSKYGIRATFFMVGDRADARPELVRAVIAQGSELGNHTMKHTELWHVPVEDDESRILQADAVFAKAAHLRPMYVRPKGGQLDDNGIQAIKNLHKVFVYWDVASCDTVASFSPAEIRDTVLEDARPGSIILFHETNPKTVKALPQIIEGLQRRGYRMQDVSELLAR